MPKLVVLEEAKKNTPPILLVDTNSGLKNTLLDLLAEDLKNKGRIYALSSKELPAFVERISPLGIHLLDKLSDSLRYSVIFLGEEQQKKKVLEVIDRLGDKTRIILVIPYRMVERYIDVLLKIKERRNVAVGMLGDVYGASSPNSPLSKIIRNALINKEIMMSGNELLSVYPILDSDAVSGIQYLLFAKKTPSLFYNLFYEHPETLISLSHLVKRYEPELSIQFKNMDLGLGQDRTMEEKNKYIKSRTTLLPSFFPDIFLGFEKSMSVFENEKENLVVKRRRVRIFKKKSRLPVFIRGIRFLIASFILYLLLSLVLFFISIFFFQKGISDLSSGKFEDSKNDLVISNTIHSITRDTVGLELTVPSGFTHGALLDDLVLYDDLSQIATDLIPVMSKVKSQNPGLSKKDIEDATASIFRLYFVLSENNIPQVKPLLTSNIFSRSSSALPLLPVLPSLLGYDQQKKYLLLFQNNSEIRPTGGFIGSVGYMVLLNGQMKNFNIQDVYDLDGQLKGHIEPPYIIRRYLQPHLYLRDSNFSPDFADSASTSALLYDLESGRKVDGIIAVDTQVLKKILSITGPIKIDNAGYVNSSNVVGLLQNTIQKGFFPGSTQKKDILRELFNNITILLGDDASKRMELLKSLPSLLIQKHILFSFANRSLEKSFVGAGFAGSLSDLRIGQNILKDFLSINEANIGVNKENEFVTRSVTYSPFLRPGTLNSDVLIAYKNSGTDPYKQYLRLIVPKEAQLLSILIDGVNQKIVPAITDPSIYERKGFVPPAGLEVDQETDELHKTIGFIVTIPGKSTVKIRVLYSNSNIVPATDSFTYSLLYIKQPGTPPYPLTVQLQTEGDYEIKNDSGTSPILYNSDIIGDREIKTSMTRIK